MIRPIAVNKMEDGPQKALAKQTAVHLFEMLKFLPDDDFTHWIIAPSNAVSSFSRVDMNEERDRFIELIPRINPVTLSDTTFALKKMMSELGLRKLSRNTLDLSGM